MLNRTEKKKRKKKEQGNTPHATPRSKHHKATQNTNDTRTFALKRSLASTTGGGRGGGGGKAFLLSTNIHTYLYGPLKSFFFFSTL